MRSVLDNWRDDYNNYRGHRSPGYVPTAEFAAQTQPSTTIQPPDSRAECY
jgi:transposase InsO family protein